MRIDLNDAILASGEAPACKLVLIAIASFISGNGDKSWPCLNTLGRLVSMHPSTVSRIIKGLIKSGALVRQRRFAASSIYSVAVHSLQSVKNDDSSEIAHGSRMACADAIYDEPPKMTEGQAILAPSSRSFLHREQTNQSKNHQSNHPIAPPPPEATRNEDLFPVDEPKDQATLTDAELVRPLAGFVILQAKDADTKAMNVQELADLIREHGAERVLAWARDLRTAKRAKAWPSELTEYALEQSTPAPTQPEEWTVDDMRAHYPEVDQAWKWVEAHSWDEAATLMYGKPGHIPEAKFWEYLKTDPSFCRGLIAAVAK